MKQILKLILPYAVDILYSLAKRYKDDSENESDEKWLKETEKFLGKVENKKI